MTREPEAVPREAPKPPPPVHVPSLVMVNTGDGKGKTTAALGTLMRSVARGWPTCVIQFMKSPKWKVGEEASARKLGIEWWSAGDGFTWESEDLDESRAIARAAWDLSVRTIAAGDHTMVMLDEITYPMNWGWIETSEVLRVVSGRPEHVNLILTGRSAPQPLIEMADTVTDMRPVKHAYDRGIRARRGIDF